MTQPQHTEPAVPQEQWPILASLSPGRAQQRLAVAVVAAVFIVFVLVTVAALSGFRTQRVEAFVPAYLTALFVCDAIAALLLYAQFAILGMRALLVIASGFVFTAILIVVYGLSFPGTFGPVPLIGSLQTSSCIFILWHVGFPLFILAYAFSKDKAPNMAWRRAPHIAILRSIVITVAMAAIAAIPCIVGGDALPQFLLPSGRFTPQLIFAISVLLVLVNVPAIVVLWKRQRSILDLWLIVVMFIYLIEIPASFYPDPTRFSLGWYAGRLFGLLGSVITMVVLLYEVHALYTRLLAAVLAQRSERDVRLMTGDRIAASIAHEIKQPLTAMITNAEAGFRFLDRAEPNLDRAKEAFKRVSSDGHRAGEVVDSIRANFKTERTRSAIDLNELIRQTLDREYDCLQRHGIMVQAEPNKELPPVQGNPVQLQQVLANLITNAIDAMASKDEPRTLCVKCETHDDGILVSVADTGAGIQPRDIERIFNPLFTTKSHGMGMGLSICRSIIEAHDGRLWTSPNTPCGAVFQFTLRRE